LAVTHFEIFCNSIFISNLYQYIQQMSSRNEERKEKKLVNYGIETCRRVLISTSLYQVSAGTFVT
jgi:hypothetical protein